MRHHSRSYSPPPRRSYGQRERTPVGGRYGRLRDAPTGLLVRNIPRDSRPEDVRKPFERFGRIKDVYLPKDYYTGEPRGFGFVKYFDAVDAAEAKRSMDHQLFNGREITVVFAEENRKKPEEMRRKGRLRGRSGYGGYRRSPYHGYSRSRSRSPHYRSRSPRSGRHSRSYSPPRRRHGSPSPVRGKKYASRSPGDVPEIGRSHSRSVDRSLSPGRPHSNSRSPSPKKASRSPRRQSRSRSQSQRNSRPPSRSPVSPKRARHFSRRSQSRDSLDSRHKEACPNLSHDERYAEASPITGSPANN